MAKLSEARAEQIRNMHADGKKYREIRDFFKENYKVTLYDSQIAKVMRETKSSRVKTLKVEPVQEVFRDEFAFHIHQAFNIHKKDFIKRVEEALTVL